MISILLLAFAIPLAAYLRHRLERPRYTRRAAPRLPAPVTTALEVRR